METVKTTRAISTRGVSKRFGTTVAVADLDLDVEEGTVVGYLGPNGAGKTTTLRMLVGLARPTTGTITVLGHDIVTQRRKVLADVGYLPGDFVAYPGTTAGQYLQYIADLRGGVTATATTDLADRLGLDLHTRIDALSHGNRQKVGLVQAFMHHPRLLLLDEPTAGLDPLVQRDFLAMVREARDEGRTVLLSSHVLSEVEAVADLVVMLRDGRVVERRTVADLHRRASRRVDLTFVDPPPVDLLAAVPGVRDVMAIGSVVTVMVDGPMDALFRAAAPHGISEVTTHESDLEDVFLAHYTTTPTRTSRPEVPSR